ncbi:MAG: SDR family NAD(P)-dependent oxidoreductase [Lachnospiraceae bacterium]|jgi:NAD(P)-dependent dehydrogenase (short-subunit alcohol dehydrogenase family)|nr:SDR family NAD(P)-dependent oxidoreductase [Lachnospiraceae bacterium]
MDKSVIITGAGAGLGFALVKQHIGRGDRVYALDLSIFDELHSLACDHANLHIFPCDIASTASVAAAVAEVFAKEERIDFLYNNAGIFLKNSHCGLLETDIDADMAMMQVNAAGLLRVCKAVCPRLLAGSMVVNITSEAGSIGACWREGAYMYAMSKAAANMASMTLQNELKAKGVRVICFHPGWVRSRMGGERAAADPSSVSPDESAADIVGYATQPETIPEGVYFMEHTGKPLPW